MQPTRALLLLEGHHGVRTALALRLHQICGDWTILAVSSLANALPLIAMHRPLAVLCDPKSLAAAGESDPVTIITTLHEQGCSRIVLTTTFEQSEAVEWQQRGAQAVLLKGIAAGVLVRCIGAVCLQSQREQWLAVQRSASATLLPTGWPESLAVLE